MVHTHLPLTLGPAIGFLPHQSQLHMQIIGYTVSQRHVAIAIHIRKSGGTKSGRIKRRIDNFGKRLCQNYLGENQKS